MRDQKGRFIRGNPGGPGRPCRVVEADYLAALTAICTLEKWERIVRRAVNDAIKGNGYARQWLAEYIIGKPVTTIDLRASEQVLLAEVLEKLKVQGVPASDVFKALLAEIATSKMVVPDESD